MDTAPAAPPAAAQRGITGKWREQLAYSWLSGSILRPPAQSVTRCTPLPALPDYRFLHWLGWKKTFARLWRFAPLCIPDFLPAMRLRFLLLIPALLLPACTGFPRGWSEAKRSTPTDPVSGAWIGTWRSTVNGH